ncbi:hypothetical protein EJ08DRAFT_683664 [Tothia fuscella]|uniref:UBA domain-containing protein n=1 Tax=Tothia fuscella TaxID=1048955 RepID=A0A9P4NFB4_9PEZI|nr:hypothetical protein EJ08DRAFT_683664 [Tothia fuscella]
MAYENMSNISPTTAFQPTSNSVNRRSLSIFSRRGAETPTPATQALALTSLTMGLNSYASSSATAGPQKSKRWTRAKSYSEPKIPEGCILRAVPKDAPTVALTPLEREMATSPNDEILRNIGFFPESAPTSPILQNPSSPLADVTNTTHSPKRYYSKRERKSINNDIIGIWRNGKAQWESKKESNDQSDNDGRPKTSSGIPDTPNLTHQKSKELRPQIQVVIPSNPSRRPFSFVPFFSNSAVDRSSKDITVTHTISQEISPPSVTSGLSDNLYQISAISPDIVPHMPKPRRFTPISTTIDQHAAFADELLAEIPPHNRAISNTSSSSDSDGDENASPCASNRSSMTSIEVHEDVIEPAKPEFKRKEKLKLSARKPVPSLSPRSEVPPPVQEPRLSDLVGLVRTSSTARPNAHRLSSRTGRKLARIDSKEELRTSGPTSPTLSEAERSLELQLFRLSPTEQPQMIPTSPVPEITLSPADLPPPPPRRSSKRKVRVASSPAIPSAPTSSSASRAAAIEATQQARKLRQQQIENDQELAHHKLRRTDSVRSILSLVNEDEEFDKVDAQAAANVVYHILSNLSTLDDLFHTAVTNRAFYRVFKNSEVQVMRQVLRNMSPAAWEYRETHLLNSEEIELDSAGPAPEYSPASYFQGYNNDAYVIDSLKEIMSERCQTLLRGEMVDDMNNHDAKHTSRADAALWRIWTFCRIFGCKKGREDDLIAQMDWLRGGLLAHQESCTSTISTSDSFYISGVLLSAPEHFARGNGGGLTAEELYDMLEMWNCLNSITADLVGNTELARRYGVYENTDVRGGDIDGEEAMLEEWHAYLHTLGLPAVLALANHVSIDPATAFSTAHQNNWTNWSAPAMGGSRSYFLREAVARLYEEKICETFSPQQVQMQEMRSIRRKRGASFANEMRNHRKLNGNSVKSFRSERPMSGWEGVMTRLDTSPQQEVFENNSTPTVITGHPALADHSAPSGLPAFAAHPAFAHSTEVVWNPCPPPYEDNRASWQHPLQRALQDQDPGTNSAEKAIFRIVEMGFTCDEAKGALKITDMGDGLKIDRAIEYLLRQQERNF